MGWGVWVPTQETNIGRCGEKELISTDKGTDSIIIIIINSSNVTREAAEEEGEGDE